MARVNPDNTTTPEELRDLMRQLNVTQVRLAQLVYVSPRQVAYWLATEGSPVPRWAVELLRLKAMTGQL